MEQRMESQLAHDKISHAAQPSRWRQPFAQVCFLISLGSLLIFFGIVDIVFHQRPLLQIDKIIAEYLQQHTTDLGMTLMTIFSELAVPGVPILAVAGTLTLAYRRRWADLILWVVAISGGLFLNSWLKLVYDAVRPSVADPLRLAFEWGFPSGHAIAALIAYGLLGVLLWDRITSPRRRIAVALELAALILVIGFSRLYVRDHYLGDVLAGYAVGASWLALCVGVWAAIRPQHSVLQ
jgi:membrane-associated phospholipid phosphatase